MPILRLPLPVAVADPPVGQTEDPGLLPLLVDELPQPARTAEPSMATAINLRFFI
jgi:hypothetical protein